MTAKFDLGQIVATPGAMEAMAAAGEDPSSFLLHHASGDWGCISDEDWRLNDDALNDGGRLLSAYRTLLGEKVWLLTEAADDDGRRLVTTILLPTEY